MYALEDEPESGNRWRRLGAGAAIAATFVIGLGYGAQKFEPTRRLIQKVVQMTVVTELPKKDVLPPPRTEPPPPPPKRPPPPKKTDTKSAAPPKSDAPPPPVPSEPVVGLDQSSFGAGSGSGAGFQVGNTLMGEAGKVAQAPPAGPPATLPTAPAKLVPAGIPARAERCQYSPRAQRLGLEGLIVIEVAIDEEGRVTRADVRRSLEPELDRECLQGVRDSVFEPATLGGRAVASTRFLRLRFELER